MTEQPATKVAGSRLARVGFFVAGWGAVGLGGLGIVVPGLPTTVFFIVAAGCFSRSSPRFERWVLALPRIGPMVADHRAGLGMARRAKGWAMASMWSAIALSAVLLRHRPWVAGIVVAAGLVGTAYIWWRVPTREAVLAQRSATGPVPAKAPFS